MGGGATGNLFNDGGTVFVNVPGRGGSEGSGGAGEKSNGSSSGGGRGNGGGGSSNCRTANRQGPIPGPSYDYYVADLFCGGVFQRGVVIPIRPGTAALPPPLTGADVAQQAFSSFRLATPGIGTTSDGGVVRFPQWFWLTGGWAEQSATASLGGISATVVARPLRAMWQPGDGSTFSCDNPGMVYRGPQDAHLRPSCSHEYTRSSALEPGKRYRVTVRVSFHMTWTATDGTSGDLGIITSPAGSTTAGVGEIQAINVPNPPGAGGS